MEPFLKIVAQDLFRKCNDKAKGLSDITVVFPNRRARLFFDDWLSACSPTPIWSPEYTTIEDLFLSQSDLRPADRIEMVSLLYDIYIDELHSDESLDSFWSWGELMLSDFDDLDRNLASADQLFSLLKDHKEMDDISFLSEEQIAALEQFFSEMRKVKETELKERYKTIWSVLGNIYNRFVKLLTEKGIGYNGMIQRRVVTQLDTSGLTARKYVFVGFNSLDKAEKSLFRSIQSAGKAMFYWDYALSYTEGNLHHEAGRFLRNNIKEFPGELPADLFEGMYKAKLTIVETSTDNAQARFIPRWLDSLKPEGKAGRETAIILADESLLQPVLHSIPGDKIENVNITMGYKLSETTLFGLVTALVDMQRLAARNKGRFSIHSISRVLGNPMTSALSENALPILESLKKTRRIFPDITPLTSDEKLSLLFTGTDDNLSLLKYLLAVLKSFAPVIREDEEDRLFKPLNQETLYRIYTQLNRLHSLIESGNLNIQIETLCRLIRSVLSSTAVPFHGEPIAGMQIMGLIETRNLDFKNVLLLSAQEGSLPRSGRQASFIPYNIRLAFGLTTLQDRSAVSSYNFHHLIQRAENVTMVYNSNADAPGIGKGQISRYLMQLMVSRSEINRLTLKSERSDSEPQTLTVEKTVPVVEKLIGKYNISREKSYLSPSALNTYMDCRLKFYLTQIARLKKPDESDTGIDALTFGTLFHKSIEISYESLASMNSKRIITRENLEALLKDHKRLEGFVEQAFMEEYFDNKRVAREDYSGIQSINYNVTIKYLRQILRMDAQLYAPFTYMESESEAFSDYMEVLHPLDPTSKLKVRLQGIIDRIDSKDDIIRIVDYKTGSSRGSNKNKPKTIDELFPPTPVKTRKSHAFQIMYYAYIISRHEKFKNKKLAPVLLYTSSLSRPTPEDIYYKFAGEPLTDFTRQCGSEFATGLQSLIDEIFNPDTDFEPTDDRDACMFCDFASLCGRTP